MEYHIHSTARNTAPNGMIAAAAHVLAQILTGSPILKTINSSNEYRGFKNKNGLMRS